MRRGTYLLLTSVLGFAGCGSIGGGIYGSGPSASTTYLAPNTADLATGPKPAVAILVPLTGPRANIGQILVQAAQLGLQDPNSPKLDVLDTGGTPQGAATAVQTAIANRDALILGPLTSTETGAVAPAAQHAGIPVLAFTNDGAKSQPGVWVLGITSDQQV